MSYTVRNGSITHVSTEGCALRSEVLSELLVNPINCRGMCVCTIQFIVLYSEENTTEVGQPHLTAAWAACASGECETLSEAVSAHVLVVRRLRQCAAIPDAYVYNNTVL